MSVDLRKHGRQVRVPEVGIAGQEAIDRASLPSRTTTAAARTVERTYVEAAGARLAAAVAPDPEVASVLAVLELEHPEARDVAEGALAALASLRQVLGVR